MAHDTIADLPQTLRRKTALITGITGQDGAYLTELLLEKGYDVHGVIRRSSSFNTERIDHLYHDRHTAGPALTLHYGDLNDATALRRIFEKVRPHEIYNLAAQSHVKVSFEIPEYTADVVALGTLRLLEALRDYVEHAKPTAQVRYYQAGSSEMFGAAAPPQSETTPFYPRSPYAASKVAAHWYAVNYREAYRLFVCNGILFNHESPRRGETFVTRKITRAVGRIRHNLQETIYLGNLDAQRDWGFARDYVRAMWLMLQQDAPDDYVIATDETHSVREFVERAFGCIGVHLEWVGRGIDEHGIEADTGRVLVRIDPRYFRPTEVDCLLGDASKARQRLGWRPQLSFDQLVRLMVEHDLDLAARESMLLNAGYDLARPREVSA
jgi:GDPmannose 4,6-dehydratase